MPSTDDKWDPEEYRKSLTTSEIVETLKCYLSQNPNTPRMPTHVCIEEAIERLWRLEGLEK